MLDRKHAQYVLAVAHEKSFGRAARRLGVTQSAVSQVVAGLERNLGQSIFTRRGGIRPTPFGHALIEQARRLDEAFSRMDSWLDRHTAVEPLPFRVGATPDLTTSLVACTVRKAVQAGAAPPGALVAASPSELELLLDEGAVDLVLSTNAVRGPEGTCHHRLGPFGAIVVSGTTRSRRRHPSSPPTTSRRSTRSARSRQPSNDGTPVVFVPAGSFQDALRGADWWPAFSTTCSLVPVPADMSVVHQLLRLPGTRAVLPTYMKNSEVTVIQDQATPQQTIHVCATPYRRHRDERLFLDELADEAARLRS